MAHSYTSETFDQTAVVRLAVLAMVHTPVAVGAQCDDVVWVVRPSIRQPRRVMRLQVRLSPPCSKRSWSSAPLALPIRSLEDVPPHSLRAYLHVPPTHDWIGTAWNRLQRSLAEIKERLGPTTKNTRHLPDLIGRDAVNNDQTKFEHDRPSARALRIGSFFPVIAQVFDLPDVSDNPAPEGLE